MRRLLLHIGHSKTGSSYMQSALALSQQTLAEAGLTYPASVNLEDAQNGQMTNGNGNKLLDALEQDNLDHFSPPPDADTVIYSAEQLIYDLGVPGGTARLSRWAARHGCHDIRLFLVIRDPVDHLVSEYSQMVKGGRLLTLPRLSRQYDRPKAVRQLIEDVSEFPHIHLTVQHYRCIKKDLIGALAKWLDIPSSVLSTPPLPLVNRTLTTDELAFQYELNRRFGRCTNLIANPLMMELHDQPGRRPKLGPIPAQAMLSRLRPDIRAVNRTLPRKHRYYVPGWWMFLLNWYPRRKARREGVRLSHEQVRVIVDGLADEIEKLRAERP